VLRQQYSASASTPVSAASVIISAPAALIMDRVNQLFYFCGENCVKKFNEFKNQGAFY